MKRNLRTKAPVQKDSMNYRALWRIVDGAVADAFKQHPDYLARNERTVRASVNKRVVGAVLGYAAQARVGSGKPVRESTRLINAQGSGLVVSALRRLLTGRRGH